VISLPVVTEQQVRTALTDSDYAATEEVTATGRFWKQTKGSRHLLVPFASGGTYPDFLLTELVARAKAINDEACATAIKNINPWERLRAKRDRPSKKG